MSNGEPAPDDPRRLSRGALAALLATSIVLPLVLLGAILAFDAADDDEHGEGSAAPPATSAPAATTAGTTSNRPTASSPTTVVAPDQAGVGDPAPDFVLPTLDECATEQLSAHRGTPVVLTFFASWCHPCEEEMPLLQDALDEQPGDFDVLALTYDDLRGDAARFAERLGVRYPTLFDGDGTVADAYGVTGIPQTWFIDADGVVQSRVYGITTRVALDEPLDALLNS